MSNSKIQPRALIEVGPDFAEELGLCWESDRREVVKKINEFREMLFLDPTMPQLFTDRYYCCRVQKFQEPCLEKCDCEPSFYYGCTVPPDIDGVLHVWADKEPLRGYSRWWEGRSHRVTENDGPSMSWIEMHESFATEVDLPEPSELSFYAEHPDDEGKTVIATIRDRAHPCGTTEIHFKLTGDGVVKSEAVVHEIVQIILPADLKGCVTLSAGETELATYPPHQTVPCFRRIKLITNQCETDQVLIHGNQMFEPICFDSDIVEVGSRLLLKHAAKMFRYGDSGTESDEIARARIEENKFKALIRGAVERRRGNAKQDPSVMVRPPLHRHTSLYKNRLRRRRVW